MTKHRLIMNSVKEILETNSNIGIVKLSGHEPLLAEDTYAAAYVIPGADTFELRSNGKGIHSYDNSLFVRCIINDNCSEDEFRWTDTRDQVIQSILSDSEIWDQAIDRTVSSVVYDDMNNYPLVTFEVIFEFTIREDCS